MPRKLIMPWGAWDVVGHPVGSFPEELGQAYQAKLNAKVKNGEQLAKAELKCVDLGVAGKKDEANRCAAQYMGAVQAMKAIGVANASWQGWPVSPEGKKADAFLYTVMSAVELANTIQTRVANKLSGEDLSNPTAAKNRIVGEILSIPLEDLKLASQQAAAKAKDAGNVTIQNGGFGWTTGLGLFVNEGTGFVVTKNGNGWYGQGNLSGKKYDLALD